MDILQLTKIIQKILIANQFLAWSFIFLNNPNYILFIGSDSHIDVFQQYLKTIKPLQYLKLTYIWVYQFVGILTQYTNPILDNTSIFLKPIILNLKQSMYIT